MSRYKLEELFKSESEYINNTLTEEDKRKVVLCGLYNGEINYANHPLINLGIDFIIIDKVDGVNRKVKFIKGDPIEVTNYYPDQLPSFDPSIHGPSSKERMEFMSMMRNEYLDEVLSHDHVVMTVIDFDLDEIPIDDLLRSMKHALDGTNNSAVGVMSKSYANSESSTSDHIKNIGRRSLIYYDAFAYRDFSITLSNLQHQEYNGELLHSILGGVINDLIKCNKNFYAVNSAFSGLASYRIGDIKSKYGTFELPNGDYACEHIELNSNLLLPLHIAKDVWVYYGDVVE